MSSNSNGTPSLVKARWRVRLWVHNPKCACVNQWNKIKNVLCQVAGDRPNIFLPNFVLSIEALFQNAIKLQRSHCIQQRIFHSTRQRQKKERACSWSSNTNIIKELSAKLQLLQIIIHFKILLARKHILFSSHTQELPLASPPNF